MKQRSPIAVLLLPFVTFGIYSLVWQVKTKNEMNQLGADIPTAWLLIVPFVGFYWLYKYSEGVEKVTHGSVSTILAFVLQFLLGSIGQAILQNEFNKPAAVLGGGSVTSPSQFSYPPAAAGLPSETSTFTPSSGPAAPAVTEPQPDSSFGGPVAPTAPQTFTPNQVAPQTPAVPEQPGVFQTQPTVVTPSAPAVQPGPNDAQPTQQS